MPLHRHRKRRRGGHSKRFYQSVGRARLDHQAWREFAHALRMQRIHLDRIVVSKRAQHAAGDECHRMSRRVLPLKRIVLVLAVIELALLILQALPQRAAEGNIHFLTTAAQT